MPTKCNACGAIYELWSEAIECHPDVDDVSDEEFAEYKAAQKSAQPNIDERQPQPRADEVAAHGPQLQPAAGQAPAARRR